MENSQNNFCFLNHEKLMDTFPVMTSKKPIIKNRKVETRTRLIHGNANRAQKNSFSTILRKVLPGIFLHTSIDENTFLFFLLSNSSYSHSIFSVCCSTASFRDFLCLMVPIQVRPDQRNF